VEELPGNKAFKVESLIDDKGHSANLDIDFLILSIYTLISL
jgi:hypothetical protein